MSPSILQLDNGQIIRVVNGKQSGYCCDTTLDPITKKVFRSVSKIQLIDYGTIQWAKGYDYNNNTLIFYTENIAEAKKYLLIFDIATETITQTVEVNIDCRNMFAIPGKVFISHARANGVTGYNFPDMTVFGTYSCSHPDGVLSSYYGVEHSETKIVLTHRVQGALELFHWVWLDFNLNVLNEVLLDAGQPPRIAAIGDRLGCGIDEEHTYACGYNGTGICMIRVDDLYAKRTASTHAYLRMADKKYMISTSVTLGYESPVRVLDHMGNITPKNFGSVFQTRNDPDGVPLCPYMKTKDYIAFIKEGDTSTQPSNTIRLFQNNPPTYTFIKEIDAVPDI